MRLETSISERDKRLLMLVGIAAVLALSIRFLIMPSMERGLELEEAIDEAAALREERRIRSHELEYLDDAIERQRAELDEASAPYYEPMATREMDDLITGLVVKHGLFPENLTMTEAAPGMAPPYIFAPEEDIPPAEDGADPLLELAPGYILAAAAELTASGDRDQWQAFLDDVVQNYPSLCVTGFDVTEQKYVNEDEETVVTYVFNCGLKIYMCRKEGPA